VTTNDRLFKKFLETEDTVQVYLAGKLHFRSTQTGIKPLLTYIQEFAPCPEGAVVFDRVVGNAAALLLKEASCAEVYGPIGSQLAAQTLEKFGISYSFLRTVPYIVNRHGDDMCPFEKASLGKSPAEFYEIAKEKLASVEK